MIELQQASSNDAALPGQSEVCPRPAPCLLIDVPAVATAINVGTAQHEHVAHTKTPLSHPFEDHQQAQYDERHAGNEDKQHQHVSNEEIVVVGAEITNIQAQNRST